MRKYLSLLTLLLLPGCGPGLCVTAEECGGRGTLVLNFAATSLRKNDCVKLSIGALDAAGVPLTGIVGTATISVSSNAKAYGTIAGCQAYDSVDERFSFSFSTDNSEPEFYLRPDDSGSVTITATTADIDVDSTEVNIPIVFQSFNAARGPNSNLLVVEGETTTDRIYIGGSFTRWDETKSPYLVRLSSSGDLNLTFAQTGTGLNAGVNTIAVQPDGKLLVGGTFTSYDGTSRGRIARLHSDGSLDTTFAPTGTGVSSDVLTLGIQSDGKIVVGGNFASFNGTSRPYILRLNADGTLDPGFAVVGTGLDARVSTLALQSDGRIVIGGEFGDYNGTARPYVARLNADGSLDATFAQTGTGLNTYVLDLAVQSDGKIVVGGHFTSYNGSPRPYNARLETNGTLDATYASTGTGLDDWVMSLALQSDGKIVLAGYFSVYNGAAHPRAVRVNSDGTLDTSFSQTGTGLIGYGEGVWLHSNNSAVLVGDFSSYNGTSRGGVVRLTSSGGLDDAFADVPRGFDDRVNTILVGSDDSVLVGGDFSSHSGKSRPSIAKLNADGTLNTEFAVVGTGLNMSAEAVAATANGKFVVAGTFTSYNGTSRPRVARLNADGSLDSTFGPTGTGLDSAASAVIVQPDDKVLVAGSFLNYNGTGRRYLARLNSTGSLDTGFTQTGTGFSSFVRAIALQTDGKVLVGGWFTTYNGTARRRAARLNADGTLDATFTSVGTGLNSDVDALHLQSDGRVVVGGSFTSYNGTSRPNIARLNSDGSLDTTFAPVGTGLDGFVRTLYGTPDGKIIVGGNFTSYNGTSRPKIARLQIDGSLDTSFELNTDDFSGLDPYAFGYQQTGKVLVGGTLTHFGAYTVQNLIRLTPFGKFD